MKIILTGNHNPHFTNTVELREKAIRALGHDLIFFNDRAFLFPGRVRDNHIKLQDWDIKRINKKLVRLVKRTRPDLCLVIGGHRIMRETVLAIKEQKVKTFLWTTDVPLDFSNILKASIFYDHIFCAGTEAIEILSRKGVNRTSFLPFACDPELHHPVDLTDSEKEKYRKDVVFVGSRYSNRQKILEGISDLDIAVWGPGWDKLSDRSPLKNKIVDKKVNYDEWVKIYSAAKIVLAIHFADNITPSKQISPKVFEAMACKRFVLSDRQEDVVTVFNENENIIFFNDVSELRGKIDFYVKNERERSRISSAGFEEVNRKHKYTDRLSEIINEFNKIK